MLGDHHDDGESPRQRDRQEVAQLRQVEGSDAPTAGGDQFPVIGEVAREEEGEGDLGELTRLEVDGAYADPDAGPTLGVAEPGNQRHQQ